MTAHDHQSRVDGCFRCDLSSDEAGVTDLAALRETVAAVIAGWDDVATAEPCKECSRDGVALWSHDDDRRMDALIERLRAALAPHVTTQVEDGRNPKQCPRCLNWCLYDGWDHTHAYGDVGIGSCTAQVEQRDAETERWQRVALGAERAVTIAEAERAAALARVDTARRDALTEAADALERAAITTEQTQIGYALNWLRARAAVESPDRQETP